MFCDMNSISSACFFQNTYIHTLITIVMYIQIQPVSAGGYRHRSPTLRPPLLFVAPSSLSFHLPVFFTAAGERSSLLSAWVHHPKQPPPRPHSAALKKLIIEPAALTVSQTPAEFLPHTFPGRLSGAAKWDNADHMTSEAEQTSSHRKPARHGNVSAHSRCWRLMTAAQERWVKKTSHTWVTPEEVTRWVTACHIQTVAPLGVKMSLSSLWQPVLFCFVSCFCFFVSFFVFVGFSFSSWNCCHDSQEMPTFRTAQWRAATRSEATDMEGNGEISDSDSGIILHSGAFGSRERERERGRVVSVCRECLTWITLTLWELHDFFFSYFNIKNMRWALSFSSLYNNYNNFCSLPDTHTLLEAGRRPTGPNVASALKPFNPLWHEWRCDIRRTACMKRHHRVIHFKRDVFTSAGILALQWAELQNVT